MRACDRQTVDILRDADGALAREKSAHANIREIGDATPFQNEKHLLRNCKNRTEPGGRHRHNQAHRRHAVERAGKRAPCTVMNAIGDAHQHAGAGRHGQHEYGGEIQQEGLQGHDVYSCWK